MRTIKRTKKFKRDYKRIYKANQHKNLDNDLRAIFTLLAADKPLLFSKYDHFLTGNWQDYRECHIYPDLILIYRKPDNSILELVRLGSHSQLGLS
ncbi:MAG: type II toxin-antitoxin system YafQ family toxin [Gammaproteobacteria bacterium]|jgi:mRNA interferase YafQ